MYRTIFFDLDGTLTDSKEGILNCLKYAFERMGRPVPPESTLIKFIGPPLQDSFMRYCGYSEEKAMEGILAFRERYAPIGKFENKPAPGLVDLCARLKPQNSRKESCRGGPMKRSSVDSGGTGLPIFSKA